MAENSLRRIASTCAGQDAATGARLPAPEVPDLASSRLDGDGVTQRADREQLASQFEVYRADEVRASASQFVESGLALVSVRRVWGQIAVEKEATATRWPAAQPLHFYSTTHHS